MSSNGHQFSDIHWDDIHFEHGYDKWQAYGQSKTANALFALQLDTLAQASGVRAFSVHPGGVLTELARYMSEQELAKLDATFRDSPTSTGLKTPPQGAATQVWAATSPQLRGLGGVYCEDCDIAEPAAPDTVQGSGVKAWATDPQRAARLWQLSAELTDIDAFG